MYDTSDSTGTTAHSPADTATARKTTIAPVAPPARRAGRIPASRLLRLAVLLVVLAGGVALLGLLPPLALLVVGFAVAVGAAAAIPFAVVHVVAALVR